MSNRLAALALSAFTAATTAAADNIEQPGPWSLEFGFGTEPRGGASASVSVPTDLVVGANNPARFMFPDTTDFKETTDNPLGLTLGGFYDFNPGNSGAYLRLGVEVNAAYAERKIDPRNPLLSGQLQEGYSIGAEILPTAELGYRFETDFPNIDSVGPFISAGAGYGSDYSDFGGEDKYFCHGATARIKGGVRADFNNSTSFTAFVGWNAGIEQECSDGIQRTPEGRFTAGAEVVYRF